MGHRLGKNRTVGTMAEQEKGLAKEEQADTWTGQKPGIPRERGDHEGTYTWQGHTCLKPTGLKV